ncbi:MAG: hypothetical protein Q8Q14_10705 [Gemmatimonadales bacterium]|nr:hypothetical protein [Gemmatimonadales bacterium]
MSGFPQIPIVHALYALDIRAASVGSNNTESSCTPELGVATSPGGAHGGHVPGVHVGSRVPYWAIGEYCHPYCPDP